MSRAKTEKEGKGGFPQLIAPLSICVATATPQPPFASFRRYQSSVLPSPKLKRFGQWISIFTTLLLRRSHYDPDGCTCRLAALCQWTSEANVSITPYHPSYTASGFYHDRTRTRQQALPFAGHAHFENSTPFLFPCKMRLSDKEKGFLKRRFCTNCLDAA